jgi:hypothetical protein
MAAGTCRTAATTGPRAPGTCSRSTTQTGRRHRARRVPRGPAGHRTRRVKSAASVRCRHQDRIGPSTHPAVGTGSGSSAREGRFPAARHFGRPVDLRASSPPGGPVRGRCGPRGWSSGRPDHRFTGDHDALIAPLRDTDHRLDKTISPALAHRARLRADAELTRPQRTMGPTTRGKCTWGVRKASSFSTAFFFARHPYQMDGRAVGSMTVRWLRTRHRRTNRACQGFDRSPAAS